MATELKDGDVFYQHIDSGGQKLIAWKVVDGSLSRCPDVDKVLTTFMPIAPQPSLWPDDPNARPTFVPGVTPNPSFPGENV